ncbi:chitinase-3-like protein 1 [Culex pipiens pallens]|uniref:chitinase-3-like protein 1 n=1 Tax=Culex pipiens pallens TaxID=42434 RepID=UPI001952E2A3|nr:chitinase-3-like protein 1 [Culex pipiens pallens]
MKCGGFVLGLVLLSLSISMALTEKKIVCYVGTWSVYRPNRGSFNIENIEPSLCTHLMYAFFGINEDGTIRIIDPYLDLEENWGRGHIKRFNELKLQHPKLKTMAAVGGWNEQSHPFSVVAASPTLRQRFIKDSIKFCKKHNFDGIDLDWEYPGQRDGNELVDRENHATWLEEIRREFDREGLLLSAAVASAEFSASRSYDIPRVSAALHFINVMTYDMHGSWDPYTGFNSPLYSGSKDVTDLQQQLNVNASIHYWIELGAPKEKIVMGIPSYGRTFTLVDSSANGIGAPASGPGKAGQYSREAGMIGYNELCEKFLSEKWDITCNEQQLVCYATSGNQWISFEDVKSVAHKMDYFSQMNLGGVMVWSLETDDFHGICHDSRYALMSVIYEHIYGQSPPLNNTTTVTPPPSGSTPTPPDGCSPEGVFPNEEVCDKYFICDSNGRRFDFSCPAGLLFDPVLALCNWPHLVDCDL